jgi:hypothetical protein
MYYLHRVICLHSSRLAGSALNNLAYRPTLEKPRTQPYLKVHASNYLGLVQFVPRASGPPLKGRNQGFLGTTMPITIVPRIRGGFSPLLYPVFFSTRCCRKNLLFSFACFLPKVGPLYASRGRGGALHHSRSHQIQIQRPPAATIVQQSQ